MPCGMLTSARCHPGGRPVLTSAWPMLTSALTGKRVNGPGAHRLVSGSHQQEVPTCQCCVSEKEKGNELVASMLNWASSWPWAAWANSDYFFSSHFLFPSPTDIPAPRVSGASSPCNWTPRVSLCGILCGVPRIRCGAGCDTLSV